MQYSQQDLGQKSWQIKNLQKEYNLARRGTGSHNESWIDILVPTARFEFRRPSKESWLKTHSAKSLGAIKPPSR